MLGKRGIRMRRDLRCQGRLVCWANQPGPPRARSGPMRPGLGALASPAPHGGWIDPEHGGDVSHAIPSIHGGQGSLTDVV